MSFLSIFLLKFITTHNKCNFNRKRKIIHPKKLKVLKVIKYHNLKQNKCMFTKWFFFLSSVKCFWRKQIFSLKEQYLQNKKYILDDFGYNNHCCLINTKTLVLQWICNVWKLLRDYNKKYKCKKARIALNVK